MSRIDNMLLRYIFANSWVDSIFSFQRSAGILMFICADFDSSLAYCCNVSQRSAQVALAHAKSCVFPCGDLASPYY